MKLGEKTIRKSIVIILSVVILTGFYYWYHLRVTLSSDSTTMIPVAMDLLQGNLLLRGWIFGTNNFLFSETIFYLPGVLVGMKIWQLLYIIPAVTFSALLVINIFTFLFYGKSQISERRKLYAAVSYVLLVGAISYHTAYTLLNANSHNGLYVFIGVEIWLIFRYLDTKKYRYVVLYIMIGALLQFSDGVFLMAMIAPAAGMCLYFGLQAWLAREKEALIQYVIIFGGTCATYALAKAISLFFQSMGGMETRGLPIQIVTPGVAVRRLFQYKDEALLLWGYKADTQGSMVAQIYNLLIVLFFVMTVFAFFFHVSYIVKRKISRERMILWLMMLFNVGGCLFTDTAIFHRYLVPTYIYGTMLLILTVMDILNVCSTRFRRGLALIGMVSCIGISSYRVGEVVQIGDVMKYQKQVAAYLTEHEMGNGYGDFFSASLIASFTEFKNNIYPISVSGGKIHPYVELIKKDWYERNDIHYIVVNAEDQNNIFCKKRDAVAMLGEPDEAIVIGVYEILYWDTDISKYLEK